MKTIRKSQVGRDTGHCSPKTRRHEVTALEQLTLAGERVDEAPTRLMDRYRALEKLLEVVRIRTRFQLCGEH